MEDKNSFSIKAKTCTLKYNSQDDNSVILENDRKYIIPIFQRPYSWKEEQIRKFINDIFISYWGNDANEIIEDIMFIGTIQLTVLKNSEQEIIDGQQRLTTFLLLLKALKDRFSNSYELQKIKLDWLTTKVNSGKQQAYLEAALKNESIIIKGNLNPYEENLFIIKDSLSNQIGNEQEDNDSFDIERFTKYMLSKVYFVVIETKAGLTKTLQIFNAINTTGLDLNGGDIFKIKMYEYLRSKKNKDESVFDEISHLYQTIDESNEKLNRNASRISEILSIYQYIIIAKNELSNNLYALNSDAFFERLFDVIFNVQHWDGFKKEAKDISLSIEDIQRIISVRYEWENRDYETAEDACAIHLIWTSRYGRYWILVFIFLYRFKDFKDYWSMMLLFTRQLNKLYIIYSIRFLKSINHIHVFNYNLIKIILNNSFEEIISVINNAIGKLENHKGWGDLEEALSNEITYNVKTKNIICKLSAMLEENYLTSSTTEIENIRTALFESEIDIEHIQAYQDEKEEQREQIWKEWGKNINSIGNLMILERKTNRSISNKHYSEKIKRYQSSTFKIVKEQTIKYPEWDKDKCENRRQKEVSKILKYLFTHV